MARYFLNNLEMRFPPLSLPFVHDNVSLAVFHDAGNVFTNGRKMLDNLLRWQQKDPGLCLQESTAAQCNYQLHIASYGHWCTLQDTHRTGTLRFRIQLESASVSELSGEPSVNGLRVLDMCQTNGGKMLSNCAAACRAFQRFLSIGQTF